MSFVLWEILIPLIVAFLLGLLCGWFLWGWRRTKITYTEWETMRQKASRASSIEAEAELAELRAENERLQAQIDDHVCEVSSDGAALGTGVLGLSGAAATTAAAVDDGEEAGDDATADDATAGGANGEAGADSGDLHPYGEGSHAPIDEAGREVPEGYPIKGNVDSMLYHRPDSRVYASTGAEVWFDTAQRAENNGFALAKSHPKDADVPQADLPVVGGERHPYGQGSHAPFSGDAKLMPEGYPIKGNADSMLYHREDSRSYRATIAEVWFDTPESAEAAGFSLANSHPS